MLHEVIINTAEICKFKCPPVHLNLIATVPKVQQLLPAIQLGDITATMRVLGQLHTVQYGASKGKDLAGKPGVGKKIRLDTEISGSHDLAQARDNHMLSGHRILLECATENNNVMHICCSMTTGKADVTVNDQSDFSSVESVLLITYVL